MAQIATITVETAGGPVDLPVYEPGDSGSKRIEAFRVQTASGPGFVPLAAVDEADRPYLRVQTANGVKAVDTSASGIPDSGVYLQDDWADGNLTSRADSNTRTQTIEGTEYETVYRPDWTTVSGSSTASDANGGYARTSADDEITADSVFWEDDLAFEAVFRYESTDGSSAGRRSEYQFAMDGSGNGWTVYFNPDSSGATFNLQKRESDAVDSVISSSWDNDTNQHTVRVERTNGQDWELFLDGSSKGTATDSFAPSVSNINIRGFRGTEPLRTFDLQIGAIDAVDTGSE